MGDHVDTRLEKIVFIGESQFGLAAIEELREQFPEFGIDLVKGFPEPLAGSAIDLGNCRLQPFKRFLQILLLLRHENVALFQLLVLVNSHEIDFTDIVDSILQVFTALISGRFIKLIVKFLHRIRSREVDSVALLESLQQMLYFEL